MPDRPALVCQVSSALGARKHGRLNGLRDEVVNLIVAVPRARNRFISGKLTETRDAAQSEFEFSRNSVMIRANFATTYVTHAQVHRDVC